MRRSRGRARPPSTRRAVKGARVDPPRRAVLLIAGPMRVAEQQVIGRRFREATDRPGGVAMRDGDPTPLEGQLAAVIQADSPHLGHRPAQSFFVEVVIPEDVIAGQPATLVDDLRSRQVAAMEQRLGPLGDQERHGRRRPLLMVVCVRDDANPHEHAPPPLWHRDIQRAGPLDSEGKFR